MSRPWLISLTVLFALAGNSAWGQDRATQAAREAIIRAMDTSVSSFCFKAPEADQTAMTVKVEDLPATDLLHEADAATSAQPVRIGSYTYEGRGVRITSEDPRFLELLVDPVLAVPRFPNGDRLVTWNLVRATGGGQCRLALTPPSATPGRQLSQLANEVGAQPHLAGYSAGATFPFGRDRFIGVMHPQSQAHRTLIVTFSARPEHGTRVEAEVPLVLHSILANPPIHGGNWSLLVIGRQADGSIVQAILSAEPPPG